MTLFMTLHNCDGDTAHDAYGPAIDGCWQRPDGTLWAGNGEYSSQVAFCPYCGLKAPIAPAVPHD